jgi:hypothetical protein
VLRADGKRAAGPPPWLGGRNGGLGGRGGRIAEEGPVPRRIAIEGSATGRCSAWEAAAQKWLLASTFPDPPHVLHHLDRDGAEEARLAMIQVGAMTHFA